MSKRILIESSSKTKTEATQVFVQSHKQTKDRVSAYDLVATDCVALAGVKSAKKDSNDNRPTLTALSRYEHSPLGTTLHHGCWIINGFHPQLVSPPNNCVPLDNTTLRKESNVDEKICEAVENCRKEEQRRIDKGQIPSRINFVPAYHKTQEYMTTSNDRHCSDDGIDSEVRDIGSSLLAYIEFFKESSVPQLITTTGGRGVVCNTKFLKICGASVQECGKSFTLYNLVAPSMLPKLFEILSLAFEEVKPSRQNRPHSSVGKSEDNGMPSIDSSLVFPTRASDDLDVSEEITYMSLTLPCIMLPGSDQQQNVTLVLMDDEESENRCFLCILSPTSSINSNNSIQHSQEINFGKIQWLNQKCLLELL